MEDKQIISLFFARDEKAIEELSKKYGRLVHQLANNILHNASDTEECVNDTYLGVWNSIPPNRPESLISYVCRIAKNLSIKRYHYNNAEKRNSNYDVALEELEGVLVSTKDVESEVEASQLTADLEHFLDSLKQQDRVVFLQRYYFSASYEDIAKQTGLSEKNVSVKLTRIRKNLRKYLTERDYLV